MKKIRVLSAILAALMVFAMLAGCSKTEAPTEEAAAPAAEPPVKAAASADSEVPTAEGEYSIELLADDTARAELTINSGRVVDIALNYAGKDSTVAFAVDSVSDETVCTAVADILTLTISGAKAGTSTVVASWTAVNTSGRTYTVEVTVNVNDDGIEDFKDLTATGFGAGSSEPPAAQGGSGEASIPPLGSDQVSMEAGGILFCGSSLMGGFSAGAYLSEDGYEVPTGNLSMGGTTIADFAAAQQEKIVGLQPGAIFINIGSVDIDRVASEVFDMQFMQDSYRDLLTYLRDNLPDCNIYVMAYYPSQENTFRPNAIVDECNVWVEELANELGINFVNVSDVLKNDRGYLREDFSADGIHLTDEAYRLVYGELKPYILASVGLE